MTAAVVRALVILGALTTAATAADPGPSLRDLINMVNPRIPVPAITEVGGTVKPGNFIGIVGSGLFTPGTVTLTLPGRTEKLDCPAHYWSDQWLGCTVPPITGLPDTPASLRVTTSAGRDSNELSVAFIATKDFIQAPASAVKVTCSTNAGVDMCNPLPPASFLGFHQDPNPTCNWASKTSGMDQYDLTLKNGWKVVSMKTIDLSTSQPTVKTASAGQTSFKVGWSTQSLCVISYTVSFRLTGPKGVPIN